MSTSVQQQPILSLPGQGDLLEIGGAKVYHRAKSEDTAGAFSVIELVSEPGEGAPVHIHEHEDELVHVLEGEIEVTLGDQKMTATAGVLALLPRGIPHGFTNVGSTPSRVLDVILPGKLDRYFVEMHELYRGQEPSEQTLTALAAKYGVAYL